MDRVVKIITSVFLISIMMLGSLVSTAFANEAKPNEISPVSGVYTNNDISGYGFSGYQQTWKETNSETKEQSIGQITSITFTNSIEGQAAADYYKANQTASFSQVTTTAGVVFSFLPYGKVGAKVASLTIAAGSLIIAYKVDPSFPLAAGDNLFINSNTVKPMPYGTPTTTTTITIKDKNGKQKFYARSVK